MNANKIPALARLSVIETQIAALKLCVGNERKIARKERERRAILRAIQVEQNGVLALGFKTLRVAQMPRSLQPKGPR